MLSQEALHEYFDYQHPTPAQIRERYEGRIVDLSGKKGLSIQDVLDSILTLRSNQALILPEDYGRGLLEVPDHPLDHYNPKHQHFIHWRYAPDVRLNTTEMSVEDAEKQQFSLKSGMKGVSWDWEQPHRGLGIVDVRTHEYTLWPFLYLLEGIKIQDLSPQLIQRESSEGYDVVGYVPRVRKLGSDLITIKNVPYLSSGEPYILATQLHPVCSCEWSHFGPRRADKRRYVGGERMMCRHGIAFYKHLIEESEGQVLNVLPRLTGIMNPWWNLNQRTIIGNERPTVTRMNALVGMLIGYMDVQKTFDLS